MRVFTTLLAGMAASLALAAPVWAVELKGSDVTQEGKRVTLHLRFSAAPEYEIVAHYAKNQLILHVTGLSLKKQQLRDGVGVKAGLKEAVNGIALALPKDQPFGEIRLQLNKGFNPGDAQVIPDGNQVKIEFIVSTSVKAGKPVKPAKSAADDSASDAAPPAKPDWQPPADADEPLTTLTGQRFNAPLTIASSVSEDDAAQITDDPSSTPDEEVTPNGEDSAVATSDTGFVPEPSEQGDGANGAAPSEPLEKPFSPEELAQFSGMQDRTALPPADSPDADQPSTGAMSEDAEQSPDEGAIEPVAGNLDSALEEAGATQVEVSEPLVRVPVAVPAFTPGPSYRDTDLGTVAVNQREFRNMPFREAIMELVSGTGFNVVVGPGIDNETVYLNFKQKELSLKSALETLCTVYELAYSLTDDVITITRQ